MFGLFKPKQPINQYTLGHLKTDMHAHWLPGIDDGAATLSDSLILIEHLVKLGYKKLIATPHVMHDYYPNTPEVILEKLHIVKEAVAHANIKIELEAAAEYYLDEWLLQQLNQNVPLLTFGQNYLLFETAFMNRPPFLEEAIFLMKSQGYQPIFAHPERYTYLWEDFSLVESLANQGVFLQINLNSLTGYYSKNAQILAEKLVQNNMVNLVGTDCHHLKHIHHLQIVSQKKYFQKLVAQNLLNTNL